MIKTKTLESIISSALFSAYIADEKPVSLLIAAEVESGKTELVTKFKDCECVKLLTDATAFSIWRDLGNEIEAGGIKHFIFPDLLTPFSKTRDTVNSFIMFLTNLTEEGITEMHTGFLPEGGIALKAPTPVGIIACIAKSELEDQRHRWARAGFMSRMIPLSYTYSNNTVLEIKDSITDRRYVTDSPASLKFPDSKVRMSLPTDIALQIRNLEELQSQKLSFSIYGFRALKHFQRLIMGYALSQGRDKVKWSDFHLLRDEFFPFMNLDYKEI